MSGGWAGGSTREWRARRLEILARDGGLCMLRLPGRWRTRGGGWRRCAVVADCVHHTVGKGVSGDDPAYLVAACTPCNLKVGEPTAADPPPRPMTQW